MHNGLVSRRNAEIAEVGDNLANHSFALRFLRRSVIQSVLSFRAIA
jgi:hypothetical protein